MINQSFRERESIPIDWRVLKLKRVLEQKITDGPHETPELLDDGIPFLSAESVKKGKLNFNLKRGFISLEDHRKFIRKCKPQKNDVFMIKSGATTGKVAIVETDKEFSIWSPLALMRANLNIIFPKYLYYYVGSKAFRKQVELNWSFGTQQNIGMGVMENLLISFPSKEIQQRLIKYIDKQLVTIDELMKNKEKLINILEEKRQIMISEAVTKGLNPKVKMKDTGVEWIGEIPNHWKLSKVKYVSDVVGRIGFRGYTVEDLVSENEGALVLGATQINSRNKIDLTTKQFISWEKYYESPEIMLEKKDLLIVQRGSSIGKVALIKDINKEMTINPTMMILKKITINEKFLYWFFNSKNLQSFLETLTSTTAIPMISQHQVENFHIPIPSCEEMESIVTSIEKQVEEIEMAMDVIGYQIQKFEEYRKSLIYEAVTGKIDEF